MRASIRAAFAAVVMALAVPAAFAQVLYKWTDRDGRVVYSDKLPPKGFDGTVMPVLPDAVPDVAPREGVKRTAPPPSPVDVATKRRDTRERLQSAVDTARVRLEAARAALEEAQAPGEDDRRITQQRLDAAQLPQAPMRVAVDPDTNAVLGGVPTTPLPRPSCRTTKGANGKETTTCARSVLSDAYYSRVEKLELAVRDAEAQLDAAQEAYRRGVD